MFRQPKLTLMNFKGINRKYSYFVMHFKSIDEINRCNKFLGGICLFNHTEVSGLSDENGLNFVRFAMHFTNKAKVYIN